MKYLIKTHPICGLHTVYDALQTKPALALQLAIFALGVFRSLLSQSIFITFCIYFSVVSISSAQANPKSAKSLPSRPQRQASQNLSANKIISSQSLVGCTPVLYHEPTYNGTTVGQNFRVTVSALLCDQIVAGTFSATVGALTLPLYDDGTHGDDFADDGYYSNLFDAPLGPVTILLNGTVDNAPIQASVDVIVVSDYSIAQGSSQYVAPVAPTVITALAQADDDYALISLPFPFSYYGQTYNDLYVSSNGTLSFGGEYYSYTAVHLPSPYIYFKAGTKLLAVYWADLWVDSNARILTEVFGTTPNRRFVITWENISDVSGLYGNFGSSDATFQAVLFETSGLMAAAYPDVLFENEADLPYSNGATACVGGLQGAEYLGRSYAYNTANSVPDGTTLYFLPPGYEGELPALNPTPSDNSTPTVTVTATSTVTASATSTKTATITHTPTLTTTVTPTLVPTASATITPTVSASPTSTIAPTPSPSASRTFTAIATHTAQATSTSTIIPSSTASRTLTPTLTYTATNVPANTLTSTPTLIPTAQATATATLAPTLTVTFSPTFTESAQEVTLTPTHSVSATPTAAINVTPSLSAQILETIKGLVALVPTARKALLTGTSPKIKAKNSKILKARANIKLGLQILKSELSLIATSDTSHPALTVENAGTLSKLFKKASAKKTSPEIASKSWRQFLKLLKLMQA